MTQSDPLRKEARPLTHEQQLAVRVVKEAGETLLGVLENYCHPGRELSLARTKIEEAVMWATKGITAS